MDGSAIIYAGLGAGLGSLLGALIASRISNKNLKSWITVLPMIIGWQGTVALYKNMKLPRIIPMQESEIDTQNPGLKALKDSSPGEYKDLIKILDEPTRKGNLDQEHLNEFRVKLTYLIEEKRGIAPPELLRQQNALAVEQFRTLRVKAPEICTAQANGRPFPVLTDILGEEYQLKEQKIMARLFNVKSSNQKGNSELGKKAYSTIITANVGELGLKTLDPKNADSDILKSEHQMVCKVFEKSMSDVNLLDDDGVRNVAAFISSESLNN